MFEVACGNCQGRLLVQQTGVVVACPHCGTHLTIGGPPAAPTPPAPAPAPAPTYAPAPQPQFAPQPQQFMPQQPAPAPQYAPAPPQPQQQFAPQPQPQFAPAPQFTPPPQQPAPAPVFQQPPAPAPQPQFAPAPQPQAFQPQPPAFAPQPVAEQPAYFAPQEPAGFNVGGNDSSPEHNWMTSNEAPVEPVAAAAPTEFAASPSFLEPAPTNEFAPAYAEQAAPQAPAVQAGFAPEPAPVEQPQWGAPEQPQWGEPEQPQWNEAPAVEAPQMQSPAAAPTFEQPFAQAPAPVFEQPFAPQAQPSFEQGIGQAPTPSYQQPAAPAWGQQPETQPAYAPAAQAAPSYPQAPAGYAPQPAAQPMHSPQPEAPSQNWFANGAPAEVAPAMGAAFGASAASAAPQYQNNPYGAAPAPYGAQPAAAQPTAAPAKQPATVSRGLFFMVVNYASIMTLIAGYLFMSGSGGGGGGTAPESPSERLPDVEPIKDPKSGKVLYKPLTATSLLAKHQTLEIGETKRFGNIEVTPTKVSVGRVEFTNLQGGSNGFISQPCDVMKLHLTFKNVSKDQSIAPLRSLAFRQIMNREKVMTSNVFVCPHDKRGRPILAYQLDELTERVKGLEIDRELKPGESCDLFIPTASIGYQQMLERNKDFVWRVQFRKGYGPRNFGVTTLIEVKFSKDKVQS